MASKSAVKISSDLFRWARESAGVTLDMAAKRIGVKPDRLVEWESTEALPTPRQLEKAADTYKRPVAAFFLPAPPKEPPLPVDFRFTTAVGHELSPKLRLAIRRARWLKAVYSDFIGGSPNLGDRIPHVEKGVPQAIADVIREWQKETLAGVRGKQPNEALRFWRASLEDAGILVFQFPMPVREAHAFSLADDVPTIVLNSNDAYARRIFSAIHELAHLVLRQPGLCNPNETTPLKGSAGVEVVCNAAAGLALVPDRSLMEQAGVSSLQRGANLRETLENLAKTYAVSRQVILRRLLELELVSSEAFRQTMDELQSEYERQQELKKKRKVIVPPSTKAVGQLGRKFVTDALAAHRRGAISDSDLADFLGVKLQQLDRVQELVGAE